MSTEDDFSAFRRVAGEELDKLRTENADLRAHAERVGQANDRLVVENDALRDSIDHAETLLCNSLPMAHCKQSDWDKLIRKWRDQKHAIDAARKEAQS